jgi:hypothetical protein
MNDEEQKDYFGFSNVETMKNTIIPEEFPEGPFGSPINKKNPVENKSTPWRDGQRTYSAYNYEFKSLHQNLPRQMEGAHPTHDDPSKDEEQPYAEN